MPELGSLGISMSTSQITIEYPEPFYSLFNTSRGDLPSIVVVNAKLREFAHRDIFPWHLSVIIEPRALAERGMPTHDECAILDVVGDEIEAAIVGNRNGLFLARETCNGKRQLLFRVHDPDIADGSLRQIIASGSQKREWEFLMKQDATWAFAEPFFSLLLHAGGADA